jgi:hypothetical protein
MWKRSGYDQLEMRLYGFCTFCYLILLALMLW